MSNPLDLEAIPLTERIRPDLIARLIHRESGLTLPGSFTPAEAAEILAQTRGWDWSIDGKRRPACRGQLLALLERIAGKESDPAVRAIGEVGNVA